MLKKISKKNRKVFAEFFFVLNFLFFLFSCSVKSEKKSFNSSLDEIDSLINQKLYKEATDELHKIEKSAYSSWNQLGIFRRYKSCGENIRAEKFLEKSLKKNSENLELRAVYSKFLLSEGRVDDALREGKKLQGTKYGSIYSEAVLKNINRKAKSEEMKAVFDSDEYLPVYFDAYFGSKDNSWLRNCALIYLKKGFYENAAELKPEEIYDANDAYFWALVSFDSKRFGDSVNYLEIAKKLSGNKIDKKSKDKLLIDVISLECDSYTSLKDEESAEKIRNSLLQNYKDSDENWLIPESADSEKLCVLFTNSARWQIDNLHDDEAVKLLTFTVTTWPDFVPSLSLYADFAYNSNLEKEKTFVQKELSSSGVATLEMEVYDNRVKIPLSDAVYRINESLKRTNDPLLYIISLDLKYKTDKTLTQKEKDADLWNVLEKNAISPSVYPELMLDYALSYLLKNNESDDAWKLFYRYIGEKYKIKNDDFFFENLISRIHELELFELEFAAYFASSFNRGDDALVLYEVLVFEQDDSERKIVSPLASDVSCINLAMIYSSMSEKDKALDLYGKAFGRTANLKTKSMIMGRMAEIYYTRMDLKNAKRAAEYSVTLDKTNVDSRMVLSRIKAAN